MSESSVTLHAHKRDDIYSCDFFRSCSLGWVVTHFDALTVSQFAYTHKGDNILVIFSKDILVIFSNRVQ